MFCPDGIERFGCRHFPIIAGYRGRHFTEPLKATAPKVKRHGHQRVLSGRGEGVGPVIERAHRGLGARNIARQQKLGLLAGDATATARIDQAAIADRQIAPRIAIGTGAEPFMLANEIEEVVIHARSLAALGPSGENYRETPLLHATAPTGRALERAQRVA